MNSPSLAAQSRFDINLGAGGEGQEFLIFGWANQEARYTWATGPESTLCFPAPPAHEIKADYSLGLSGFPHVKADVCPFQRLQILVNGHQIAKLIIRSKFDAELVVDAEIFAKEPQVTKESKVTIVFRFPDAQSPAELDPQSNDLRKLGIAFSKIHFQPILTRDTAKHVVALSDREILMDLQSLGVNCELGFVQRSVGAEPLGLLRWNSITLPDLINALNQRFDGFGAPENIDVIVDSASEIMIIDKKYNCRSHSHAFENKGAKVDAIYKREIVRIPYLVRMLIRTLEEASRLFVFHDAGRSSLVQAQRLVEALSKYGSNMLLWVTTTSDTSKFGTVEWIGDNLMVGYIDRFQPVGDLTPDGVSVKTWLSIARQAHGIWREKKVVESGNYSNVSGS